MFFGRVAAIEQTKQRINEQIRVSPVRVVSPEGEQLGIMSTEDAIAKARESELDLVEVAPNEKPPVCRIMDFGKFKYQQKKRQHKTHTHQVKSKEIRLRPKIGKHDLDFKVDRARLFLGQKDKVLVSVIFRGRENAHVEEGYKVVNTFVSELGDLAKVEQPPQLQGRRITLVLTPK